MRKNNATHNGYRTAPICDAHMHTIEPMPLADLHTYFENYIRYFNSKAILFCGVPLDSAIDNLLCFYAKAAFGMYASPDVHHYGDERDTAQGYLEQAKAFYAMGADGFKMLEAKPQYNRMAGGRPIDHPIYDLFYAYLQEKNLPIVMHVGDPARFWDMSKATPFLLEKGWMYDESYPTLEELRGQFERVLQKFPRLRITLAHIGFLADDLDRVERLLQTYPNLTIDLTPAPEQYRELSTKTARVRELLTAYADRILYGTDNYNQPPCSDEALEATLAHATNLVRMFLEYDKPFVCKWLSGEPTLQPLHLEEDVLDKIYCENFYRIYGKTPRPLDFAALGAYCAEVAKLPLAAWERENMTQLTAFFAQK